MKYRVPSHVHARAVADEVVILDARADAYLGLNRTAATVWDCLVGGRSAEAAADALVTRFAVDRGRARSDVDLLVAELVGGGLLEPIEG